MSKHVVNINGQSYTIPDSDIWRKPGCDKDIITHDGVRRLMMKAGITIEKVDPIVMPINGNGSRIAFLAAGTNADGRRSFAVGEADPSNLTPNSVAARYPTIMAFKRAVDRLVLDLLGLFDLYSDVEFAEPAPAQESPSPAKAAKGPKNPWADGDEPSSTPTPGDSGSSPDRREYGNNGKGSLPPSEKQLSYLLRLAQQNHLTQSETDQLLRTVRTRTAASQLIQRMKLAA